MLFSSRTNKVIDIDAEPKVTALPIKEEDELYRITEISNVLDINERVLLVITQSKVRLADLSFTSYIIYATERRIIIRDISLHGLKENTIGIPYSMITDINRKEGFISARISLRVNRIQYNKELPSLHNYGNTGDEYEWIIEHIPNSKALLLVNIVRAMINKWGFLSEEHQLVSGAKDNNADSFATVDSPADELLKIARLRSEGVINEQEFFRLKQNIIGRIR